MNEQDTAEAEINGASEQTMVKIADLSGPVLDGLAAIAFGLPREDVRLSKGGIHCEVYLPNEQRGENIGIVMDCFIPGWHYIYRPTVWWHHVGPLIDMEDISIEQAGDSGNEDHRKYAYTPAAPLEGQFGSNAMEAVVRCFVAAKLGAEIPESWLPKAVEAV
jgi:hypothetical protein